ncbi:MULTISPECIES: riboflavin synthase subunit alpha [Gammaproteobacteria]|uniref:Riboflavin synthase n=1 Tax=Vreelandella halophila TaxID=86177 RepID=A0A9X4YFL3_9GAMM|nr:riboflavin synthase subunit alpha [Halospina sp. K52047b]KAA8984300.1 riboflavin synthase subunit alpha [Halospina sp. K52047b]MYL26975.1 riboflavin synthase subunit alpha [Halomonas utahensis]MYL74236.1 riboflavin synthase subunit alpha [Halomonas sp. 22501_18_FS]
MFTGIVQGIAQVATVERLAGLHRISLRFPENFIDGIAIGASVSVNGACLTVTEAWPESHLAAFDVMMETLRVTTLGELQEGSPVNVERAARIGDEIGGHLLSGHVHCMARVSSIEEPENNRRIAFSVPHAWRPYLISKGYIAVDGASLTIAELTSDGFAVYLIPETLRATRFGALDEGDHVNIEIDHQTQTIIDTLNRLDLVPRGAD